MFTNMFRPDQPSRRSFLIGAGLAAAAMPLLVEAASASEAVPLAGARYPYLDNPQTMLETYLKMAGDTSGKPYGGWYSGHAFAWMPDQMTRPLFGFTGFGLGSDHRQPDGSFQHIWHEVGFYTDLKTGEVLETWQNPLNGETCDVMPINNRSVNLTFKAHVADYSMLAKMGGGIMNENFADPNDPARPFGMPYAAIGDHFSIFADSVGFVPNPLDPAVWKRESSGKMLNVNEFYMVTGSKRLALDPAVTNVPVSGSWTRLAPYLPWMLMGEAPGHLFYRSSTKKISGPEALPPALVAYTASKYPEYLKFPSDFGVPIESSWNVYKQTHKPHP